MFKAGGITVHITRLGNVYYTMGSGLLFQSSIKMLEFQFNGLFSEDFISRDQ